MEKSNIHHDIDGLPNVTQTENNIEKYNVVYTKSNDPNMHSQTENGVGSNDKTQKGLSETKTATGSNNTAEESIISIKEEDTCVFCLEPMNLIHFCECAVMAHKICAVSYVTYPTSVNGSCPMCRRGLAFDVISGEITMKTQFIFYIILIILANLGIVALSMYITTLVIPQNGMNIYLYILIICNVGIFAPLTIVFLLSLTLELCGPQVRSTSSGTDSGGCEGCSGVGCSGDGFEIIILGICLLLIVLFLISAIAYIIYNVWRYHQSFRMKSAVEIQFRHERKVA